jgi:hypothetical protein
MNVPDHFGLHVKEPTEAQINAGAKALRERMQGGAKATLRPWRQIPNSSKKKWRDYAMVVLCASLNT